jgi:2'-5' RNA ligase
MTGDGAARLFVALDLPPHVVEALTAWRAPLLREHDGLRPVAPGALHVTLCFLGWRGEDAIGAVAGAVASAARGVGAVHGLALASAVWLPPRRARVLAVTLADGAGALATLQHAVSERLAAGGWYEPEARSFLPHVTVARVRGAARPPRRAVLPAIPEISFAGAAVTLYRSRLHPSGARYESLSRSTLA